MAETQARHPRREAGSLLAPGHEARVLEPSPPANEDPAWFADDPTDPSDAAVAVTPIPGEGATWAQLAQADDAVAAYAHDHWLDGVRPLVAFAAGFQATRDSLHQVAFFVLAPARYTATGKLGLRYTHRGFGTPFSRKEPGQDEQVRVEGGLLVHQVGETARVTNLTTLAAAASFLDLEYEEEWFDSFHDPLDPIGPTAPLEVDPAAADVLGGWFGFATHVLERLRRAEAEDISRVQLWPEHFDAAIEAGSSQAGQRASYGASPGDASHPEPYLFVTPWDTVDESDPYWNAPGFVGAILGHAELVEADDPYSTAIDFYLTGLNVLTR
ncbi:MAG: hypothetical protein WEA76_03835 [Acidimicrobiia bacterium]